QRRTVRRWSVKIQFQGHRKTFSLQSARRSTASQEACRLYRHLMEAGWNAIEQVPVQRGLPAPNSREGNRYSYWRQHLVHRDYTAELHSDRAAELAVRLEHEGIRHYFPLGTTNIERAAAQAHRIFRTILTRGWEWVNQRFSRELTLAF